MTATDIEIPAVHHGNTADAVRVSRWPHIPAEELEVAEIIAAAVDRARQGEPASVLHEERLGADVASVISHAIELPQGSGLPLAVVAELAGNPHYRASTQRNAVILASHLHPLSMLIYGAELENITCLGYDHWLVSTVGRAWLIGATPIPSRRRGARVLSQCHPPARGDRGPVPHRRGADRRSECRQCDPDIRASASDRRGIRPGGGEGGHPGAGAIQGAGSRGLRVTDGDAAWRR